MPETELLKSLGEIAGIGGIALGVVLFLLRDLIANVLRVTTPEGQRTLRLVAFIVLVIGLAGIGATLVLDGEKSGSGSISTTEPQSPVVTKTKGSVTIDIKSEGAKKASDPAPVPGGGISTSGGQSPVVKDTGGDVNIKIESGK